jgi:hypothetical protein
MIETVEIGDMLNAHRKEYAEVAHITLGKVAKLILKAVYSR